MPVVVVVVALLVVVALVLGKPELGKVTAVLEDVPEPVVEDDAAMVVNPGPPAQATL